MDNNENSAVHSNSIKVEKSEEDSKREQDELQYETYQNWVLSNYGDYTKTKTITNKKYERIVKTLRGEIKNCAENSRFRFWMKLKKFRLGLPLPGTQNVIDENQLYVLENKKGGVPTYKKVAIVEDFFKIIHKIHVERNGSSAKHAGQKRTYRRITETYGFLPREAVTKFLLGCSKCSKKKTECFVPSPKPNMSIDHEENAYNFEPLSKKMRLTESTYPLSCSPQISNMDEKYSNSYQEHSNSPYKFQNDMQDHIKMKREQLDAYLNQQSSEIIPIAISNTPLDLTKRCDQKHSTIQNHNSPPNAQHCHIPMETSTPCSKQSTKSSDTQKSKDILDVSPIRTTETQAGDANIKDATTNKTNHLSYNPKQNFIGKFYSEYGTRIFIDNNNGLQLKSGIQLEVAASLKDSVHLEDQINVSNLDETNK
ncbi:hypothetical protein M8J76_000178 [Diaphorina citri]|nr:hypothetical protein M8J76_000178 [Diaphorina citri]